MEVELLEIRDFIAGHPPFDCLPADALDRLPKELAVRYLRRGTSFPPTDANGDFLYLVRTGAVELRDKNDSLIGKYGEGDIYSGACVVHGLEDNIVGVTVEDSLFYLLPCSRLKELQAQHSAFNEHFNESLRERLRRALSVVQSAGSNPLLSVEVEKLLNREPISVAPGASIQEAARVMTDKRVSALLIVENDHLVGIITDRDLRSRVVAEGLAYSQPISEIMTRKLIKVSPDTIGFEALMIMSRLNVHHLPVVGRDGVMGIITDSDLLRYQSTNAVYMARDVRKCQSVDELVETCKQLPEMQLQLIGSGASATHLGQAISSVTDALTERLIALAEEQLGAAPVPYVWLAIGSQARREQTVHSDQDNALLIADDYNAGQHGDYFSMLAKFVTDGLNACGFVYCPGEVMASNPEWRQPYSVWRRYFNKWITTPERKSLMLACNFFDMRPVHGDVSLYDHLHAEVLRQTQENKIFLAYMAANALTHKPPLGFFRNFVLVHDGEHDNALNLKTRGLIPITDLARIFALAAGVPEINTLERLRAAADASAISEGSADNLEDALEFIAILRARHQAGQIKRGFKPDNYINPDDLSKLERNHLKDAFSVISDLQETLEQRYQTSRFYQ